MAGDLSFLALSVCVPAGECVGNGVGVCICVPYIPRRNAFPGSWRPCFGCWCAKFRLLLSNFPTHPTPPRRHTHTHTLPSAARQADRVGAWCQLPPPPITKTLTPHKFVFDAKTKTRGKQKTRMDQNKISVH